MSATIQNYRCVKCGGQGCEVVEVSTTGGGIARFFDFQNRRFSAVVCDRCKFTEFYRTRASGLSKLIDFVGSG
jgi:predicted nucleic-acid-binding Zn-ribbon protein